MQVFLFDPGNFIFLPPPVINQFSQFVFDFGRKGNGHKKTHYFSFSKRYSRTIFKAACEPRSRLAPRSPEKTNFSSQTFFRSARAIKVKPTGFSSEPPPGPAMPVTP